MKPSDFKKHPYDSVFQNNECETVARNIMVILWRTGDSFRELPFSEYLEQKNSDGGYSSKEKELFEKVSKYCFSEEMAKKFSPAWRVGINPNYR